MLGKLSLAILAAAGLGLTASPAADTDETRKKVRDPNEMVCETVKPLGSRVATKRICATRAEWEEYRRQDRDSIDKGQRQLNMPL